MIYYVFTVRDEKAEAFLTPFYLPTEALAKRAMVDCVNDSNHGFNKHPEDYSLWALGSFDDMSGKHEILDNPKHVFNLVDLVEAE